MGLGELAPRIDEEGAWDQTLSGGERQRIAFARLLIHRPDICVMDESTSALDKDSQGELMTLVQKQLPNTTIVSVGHRPELEEFHDRKLILEYRKGGARIVSDEILTDLQGQQVSLLQRILRRRRREMPPVSVPERHPGDRLSR